jgi:hypothetical protein
LPTSAPGLGALRQLDLKASWVSDKLPAALDALPQLSALNLCDVVYLEGGVHWKVGEAACMACALASMSCLEVLQIGTSSTGTGVEWLVNMLAVAIAPPALRALALSVPSFIAADEVFLAMYEDWLPAACDAVCRTSLVSLDLSESKFGTEVGPLFPLVTDAFPVLRRVSVQRCGADAGGLEVLGEQMREAWGACAVAASGDGVYAKGDAALLAQSFVMDTL